ncbi:Peptidase inhibitor I78 family protein [Hyphomicrobiales bacterium]|nr:Peptidase inhibitor I78 family protein [Hyphomicrobiales bacterium]CAH1677545.1 Peptidase inhibitor I78 family protein [Hyphomicrobiales bacterium]
MKAKRSVVATFALAATTVAACQNDTRQIQSSAAPGLCRVDAAEALKGSARLTDERAKETTGATLVRQIAPGQGVTMDYRQERVTIETDSRTGKILRAFCG